MNWPNMRDGEDDRGLEGLWDLLMLIAAAWAIAFLAWMFWQAFVVEAHAHPQTEANVEQYRQQAETACLASGRFFVFREEYTEGRFMTACYEQGCKPSI